MSNRSNLFFANYAANRALQVIIIFTADVINVDKIISKRIPYLVFISLANYNSFSELHKCEMGFSALACMKDKCRNRLDADSSIPRGVPRNLKGEERNLKSSVFRPKSSEEQKRSSRPQIIFLRISPLHHESFVHLSTPLDTPAPPWIRP